MVHKELLKVNKQLLIYNHIHLISENKPIPVKTQKELWIKIWSLKRRNSKYRAILN